MCSWKGGGHVMWRPELTTSVCQSAVFLVTFRLPSAAALPPSSPPPCLGGGCASPQGATSRRSPL